MDDPIDELLCEMNHVDVRFLEEAPRLRNVLKARQAHDGSDTIEVDETVSMPAWLAQGIINHSDEGRLAIEVSIPRELHSGGADKNKITFLRALRGDAQNVDLSEWPHFYEYSASLVRLLNAVGALPTDTDKTNNDPAEYLDTVRATFRARAPIIMNMALNSPVSPSARHTSAKGLSECEVGIFHAGLVGKWMETCLVSPSSRTRRAPKRLGLRRGI